MSDKKTVAKNNSPIFPEYVSTAIAIVGAVIFFGCYLIDYANELLGGLCILVSLFCLALYLHYLPRFHEERALKKSLRSWHKLYSRLEAALLFSTAAAYINNLKPSIINLGRLWLLALIPFAAMAAVFIIRSRHLGKITVLLILPIIVSLFISFCSVNTINCLHSPVASEYHTATIIDKDTSGGRHRSYHLTMEYEDENMSIRTGLNHYNSVAVGDTIDISVNTGLLGIQYIEIED